MIDGNGVEVASTTVRTPFRSHRGRVEMDVHALWEALRRVVGELGDHRHDVAAVGITGMAESGAPLDRGGQPLAPVIAWHDDRGTETVALLEARFGDELSRRIGQRLRTVSSVAKLGWSLAQGLAEVHRWLGVPELCLFALTGSQVTDHSLAARTGCYDVTQRAWWSEVPAALGFAVEVLPPVRAAGAVLGRVSTAGASWSGLPIGVPVTLAGHDHLAALAGSGARPGDFGNSVGTAESVAASADELPDVDRALDQRVALTVRPEGDGWALLSGAARAGRVIEALSAELRLSPAALDVLAGAAGDAIDAVDATQLLDAVLVGKPLVMPWGSPGVIWNGLLRALAERTWEAVDRAASLVGPPLRLIVFGGGSRSDPWLQAKASLGVGADVAVWRSRAGEAAARGAALQAGVAAGWWPSTLRAPRAELEEVDPRLGPSVGAGADPGAGHDGQGDGRAHEREDHEDGG